MTRESKKDSRMDIKHTQTHARINARAHTRRHWRACGPPELTRQQCCWRHFMSGVTKLLLHTKNRFWQRSFFPRILLIFSLNLQACQGRTLTTYIPKQRPINHRDLGQACIPSKILKHGIKSFHVVSQFLDRAHWSPHDKSFPMICGNVSFCVCFQ